MSLKLCFDDEIHKISKLPLDVLGLHDIVNAVFRENLPPNYRLEYLDNEGDRIVIANNSAYKDLVESGLPSGRKALKVYVSHLNKDKKKGKTGEQQQDKKTSGPIHIQNKEEFAEDLPRPERTNVGGKIEAPSDESLPSSSEDHEEKVHEINESVEDLKKGGAELQPEIYADPESDKEMKKVEKKKRKSGEKEQKKMKKLMDKMRQKDLSEEKKAKVVNKLMKYKESLTEKQKEKTEKTEKPEKTEKTVKPTKEKETKSSPDPLQFVINQVLQNMLPEITRMVGEHPRQPQRERPSQIEHESVQAKPTVQKKVTHPRIICDGCNMRPIVGVRYKCTVCPNFDYCENCEETMGHPHPFVKIKTPQQDYFSHGLFYDNVDRRHPAVRAGHGFGYPFDEFFGPMHGHEQTWQPRITGQRQEPVSSQRQEPTRQYEERPSLKKTTPRKPQQYYVEKTSQQQQQQVEKPTQQQQIEKPTQQPQHQAERTSQQQQHRHVEKPLQQRRRLEKPVIQYVEKPKTTAPKEKEKVKQVPVEREKENYPKTDRSDEVEIEDETYLIRDAERYNVMREGNELRERQNEAWIPEEEEEEGLEKGKKTRGSQREQLGDVKTKASRLKKEFPDTKFDTLIKYVEEAPDDLTTEELVNNFLSWR